MTREQTPTIRRWRLGQELRHLRLDAKVSARDAAAELSVSQATLSKIENGKQSIKPLYVKLLVSLYGAITERERLLEEVEEANRPEWYVAHAKHVPDWFRQYLGYEAAAKEIRTYAGEPVDGVLQTEAYAREIGLASEPGRAEQDLESYLALRRERQERVIGPRGPVLHTIVNEATLRREVGGRAVMREQLLHLADVADLSRVTLQVLPFAAGAHPAMTAPFTLLGFEIAEMDTVYLENGRGAVYLEAAVDLQRYDWIFKRLTELALTPSDSQTLLRKVAGEL